VIAEIGTYDEGTQSAPSLQLAEDRPIRGRLLDYARSLQAAKRWVRRQDKWKAPYYWASLVLIGPP
jgi:hypothetical protein